MTFGTKAGHKAKIMSKFCFFNARKYVQICKDSSVREFNYAAFSIFY